MESRNTVDKEFVRDMRRLITRLSIATITCINVGRGQGNWFNSNGSVSLKIKKILPKGDLLYVGGMNEDKRINAYTLRIAQDLVGYH